MKILLTGANGYIGKRLLPILLEQGHEVIAVVRDKKRFHQAKYLPYCPQILELDFLNPGDVRLPDDIDAAFYLIHSMSSSIRRFTDLEELAALHFLRLVNKTNLQQIIYLGGIINGDNLSKHLESRKKVEEILRSARASLTTLRAGIILGSGSASFEIIRDLVEKLPIMITPKWLKTKCQPIAIRNVVEYLCGVLLNPNCMGKTFDIGGPDILTYREMLERFAKIRKLKRIIILVPFIPPRLSSFWLFFVTSTSYKLAINLVNSMKVEVVCSNNDIHNFVPTLLIDYDGAIKLAFERIKQNMVLSSWKDAMISGNKEILISNLVEVPEFGCYNDYKKIRIKNDPDQVLENIWGLGGKNGWYYGSWLWKIRGRIDKFMGGVGLRRGRTNLQVIETGDALDFWRVIYASKHEKRLLLFAEMKVPGEAWLEFKIFDEKNILYLEQTAIFRPRGIAGRLYWYSMLPFHHFIFKGMIENIERTKKSID